MSFLLYLITHVLCLRNSFSGISKRSSNDDDFTECLLSGGEVIGDRCILCTIDETLDQDTYMCIPHNCAIKYSSATRVFNYVTRVCEEKVTCTDDENYIETNNSCTPVDCSTKYPDEERIFMSTTRACEIKAQCTQDENYVETTNEC